MSNAIRDVASRMSRGQALDQLVEATIRLLAHKGPSEIKARSVAEAAGVSTSAVYYHVGGLPELLQAVVDRGFSDLDAAFQSLPTTADPVSDLFRMALATRNLAQQNPHLYDLMFGLSTRGTYRPLGSRATNRRSDAFQTAYADLTSACGRLLESSRVRPADNPALVADKLWSCVHGFVTLELGGHFTDRNDPVRDVLMATTVDLFVGMGDLADRAIASHMSVLP